MQKRRSSDPQRLSNEKWKYLIDYDGKDRVISSREMARSLREKPDNRIRVKSLIPSLDASIEDFRGGELIVISGHTKMGKTLFAQTLTLNFAQQKHFSLWFPYEVPIRQFNSQFPSLPHFYLPRHLMPHALPWLIERVYECYWKHKTRIVFIDHLHYLLDMGRTKSPSIDIGAIIRQLKHLAVKGRFIIFLLAHTTKGRPGIVPGYEDIRDSSFIAQESDCVLIIHRTPRPVENASLLRVEFHRRTGVMGKTVALVKFKGLLMEKNEVNSKPGTGGRVRIPRRRRAPHRRKRMIHKRRLME